MVLWGGALIETKIANRPVSDDLLEMNLSSFDGEINHDFFKLQGSRLKGLAGSEYLLFMENSFAKLIDSLKHMSYLLLIGEDLALNAAKLTQLWDKENGGYRLSFSATDDVDMGSTITMLMSKISEITNKIYLEKLDKAFFKVKYEKGSVLGFESWRSKSSKDLIKANLASIQSMFDYGLYDYLKYLDADELADKISTQFIKIDKSLNTIPRSFEQDSKQYLDKYPIIVNEVRQLLILLKAETANKLGVTISYAGNDGD